MSTLLLRLAAPLQSWGFESKYDVRRTDFMPTKSGVLGLVAAALGMERGESLDELSALRFGIRIDSAGTIVEDFQVTQMGEKLNSNISRRMYLSDAIFVAGLESEDEEYLAKLEYALKHPEFPLFLGRRSCPPTLPLVLGIRKTGLDEALAAEPWQVPEDRRKKLPKKLRIIVESTQRSMAVRRDVPVSFSPYGRDYGYRYLKELDAKDAGADQIAVESGETAGTVTAEHDAMAELED